MLIGRPQGNVKYDNSGRVALVTGGANGIGRAICEALLHSSASGIVCVDINEPTKLPRGIDFRYVDTSAEEDCHAAVEWTVKRYGALDILVNNAAVQPPESFVAVDKLYSDIWHKLIGINFSGYMFMAKYALQQMKQQRSGVVINIASAIGHRAMPQVSAYGPIKAANIFQAKQWGVEYARDGIRVVSVSPGGIDTPLGRAVWESSGGMAAISRIHPMARVGKPEEVANAVLWLASADASFVTATDLAVDGGLGGVLYTIK